MKTINLKRILLAVTLFFLCIMLHEAEGNPQDPPMEAWQEEVELIICRGEEQGVDRLIEILAELQGHSLYMEMEHRLYMDIYKALCSLVYTQRVDYTYVSRAERGLPRRFYDSYSKWVEGSETVLKSNLPFVDKANVAIHWLEDNILMSGEDKLKQAEIAYYYRSFFNAWRSQDYQTYLDEVKAGKAEALDNFISKVLAGGFYMAHPQLLPYLARANLEVLAKNVDGLVEILKVLYPPYVKKYVYAPGIGADSILAQKYKGPIQGMLIALQGFLDNQSPEKPFPDLVEEVFGFYTDKIVTERPELDERLADAILVLTQIGPNELPEDEVIKTLIDYGYELFLLPQLFSLNSEVKKEMARKLIEYKSFNADMLIPLTVCYLFETDGEAKKFYQNAFLGVLKEAYKFDSRSEKYFNYLAGYYFTDASNHLIQKRLSPLTEKAVGIVQEFQRTGDAATTINQFAQLKENIFTQISETYNPFTAERLFSALNTLPQYQGELEKYTDFLRQYFGVNTLLGMQFSSLKSFYTAYLEFFTPEGRDLNPQPNALDSDFSRLIQERLERTMAEFILQVKDKDAVDELIKLLENFADKPIYWADRYFVAKFLETKSIRPKDDEMDKVEKFKGWERIGNIQQPQVIYSGGRSLYSNWVLQNEQAEKLLGFLIFGADWENYKVPDFVIKDFIDYFEREYRAFFKEEIGTDEIVYLTANYKLPQLFAENVLNALSNIEFSPLADAYLFFYYSQTDLNKGQDFLAGKYKPLFELYGKADPQLTRLIGKDKDSLEGQIKAMLQELPKLVEKLSSYVNELEYGLALVTDTDGEGYQLRPDKADLFFLLVDCLTRLIEPKKKDPSFPVKSEDVYQTLSGLVLPPEASGYLQLRLGELLYSFESEWGQIKDILTKRGDMSELKKLIGLTETAYAKLSSEQKAQLAQEAKTVGITPAAYLLAKNLELTTLVWGDWLSSVRTRGYSYDGSGHKKETDRVAPKVAGYSMARYSPRELMEPSYFTQTEFLQGLWTLNRAILQDYYSKLGEAFSLLAIPRPEQDKLSAHLALCQDLVKLLIRCPLSPEQLPSLKSEHIAAETKLEVLEFLSDRGYDISGVVPEDVKAYLREEFYALETKFQDLKTKDPNSYGGLQYFCKNIDGMWSDYLMLSKALTKVYCEDNWLEILCAIGGHFYDTYYKTPLQTSSVGDSFLLLPFTAKEDTPQIVPTIGGVCGLDYLGRVWN